MVPRPSSPRPRLVPLLVFAWTAWALLPAAASGAAPAEPATLEPWTVEDLLKSENVRQIALSPDGKLAVWSVQGLAKVGKEEKRLTQLWARSLESKNAKPVQLTRGESNVGAFQISPDGKNLAFTTDRKVPGESEAEGNQIWLLPLASPGEPRPISTFDRGVDDFAFIDAETLLVARQESKGALEAEYEKGGDAATAVSDPLGSPPSRLFKLTLEGKATRISRNAQWISGMGVTPDGKKAVVVVAQDLDYEFNSKVAPKTFVVDLATAEWKEILAGTRVVPGGLRFSPDSQSVYLLDAESSHPLYETASISQLYRYDLGGGKLEKIELKWPRGLADSLSPFWPLGRAPGARAEDLLVLLADGVHFRGFRLEGTPQGLAKAPLAGGHAATIERFAVSRDGRTVLYQASTLSEPPQLYAARLDGHQLVDEQQVSELNAFYKNRDKGRYEVIHFAGANGDQVEGLLLYPFGFQEGKKYPLVLDIHGGPASADIDTWDSSLDRIWQQKGAFVLQVNYHGSSSYGLAWVESIREKYYELEIPDIEAGVDYLIGRGLVDPDRMASTGWSNGGILTAELITRTQRYQAAVVGAADVEWLSDWGNVDFGASFDNYYFGGPPWEKVQYYIDKSPFFRLGNGHHPDPHPHRHRRPQRAAAPELVDVPGAPGHRQGAGAVPHLSRRAARPAEDRPPPPALQRRRGLAREVPLQGRQGAKIRRSPPASLLAGRLARAAAARDGPAATARSRTGSCCPSWSLFGKLEVGRFEVTRAQFAEFAQGNEAGFVLKPGEENLPVTGIGFEQAKAYAAWAARKLRRSAAAHQGGGRGAGREGRRRRQHPGQMAGLRRQSGRRRQGAGGGRGRRRGPSAAAGRRRRGGLFGDDGPAVYDLDGNAAEWALEEKAKAGSKEGDKGSPAAPRRTGPTTRGSPAARRRLYRFPPGSASPSVPHPSSGGKTS